MQNLKLQIFLFATICLFSCSDNNDSEQTNLTQSELLLKAYKSNSTEELHRFFEEWESLSVPKTIEEIQNEPTEQIRATYRIFEQFYNPFSLNQYGDSTRLPEVGDEFYKNTEFIIIQN